MNELRKFITDCDLKLEVKTMIPTCYGTSFKKLIDEPCCLVNQTKLLYKRCQDHPDRTKSKLIFGNKKDLQCLFDDGELCVDKHMFYILGTKQELQIIQTITQFRIFTDLIKSDIFHHSKTILNKTIFDYIPDLRILNIEEIVESDFYEMIEYNNKFL